MANKLTQILKKYREQISYLFFGGLTTLVSIGSFSLFYYLILNGNNLVSNLISETIAITFAYVTNKLFVFNSKTNTAKSFLMELISFFALRIVSSFVNIGAMYLLVDILHGTAWLWKIIVNVVIIILNYIFSKLFVFKKGENNQVDGLTDE
ncbi:MAG: GtrA family protein [Clostridia bacterium]|nr:GtrA family protein [Clostridia bacterium]